MEIHTPQVSTLNIGPARKLFLPQLDLRLGHLIDVGGQDSNWS